jgi:hypothetical protein
MDDIEAEDVIRFDHEGRTFRDVTRWSDHAKAHARFEQTKESCAPTPEPGGYLRLSGSRALSTLKNWRCAAERHYSGAAQRGEPR